MGLTLRTLLSIWIALVAFIYSSNSPAEQNASGGVIHFRGQIVEGPCEIKSDAGQIQLNCLRDGTKRTTYHDLTLFQKVTHGTTVSTRLEYLDSKRNQGLYTVHYR
ncbi:hypothetical protein [Superficieibacter sp.]|uniref:hypothetical protein n=1 Tax=Superficieibacter sp. TaxID=2303322 RepID=UPI0028B19BA6|nr:hypothetical protein [Superficieibacter sp.]